MSAHDGDTPPTGPRRPLGLVLLLFVASGCAALIDEVVWLQLLQLTLGSTALALAVLLATFMGGLCVGSLLLPRTVAPCYHPIRVFALLELAIGVLGLAVLLGLPELDRLYARVAGSGLTSTGLASGLAALCLLPPTVLMGATFPAMARWVESSQEGISRLGFFYAGNLVGGVIGCLLSGFYLLRVYDIVTAGCVASSINIAGAAAGLLLARKLPYEVAAAPDRPGPVSTAKVRGVYLAIALSGACALGAEVTWTRLLSLLLGATVYTFSLILAVFLVGLGIGSAAGALVARRAASPPMALAICQWLLAPAVAWTAFAISRALPNWPFDPAMSPGLWFTFMVDLVRCLWAVLPPACLWGASIPLALVAAAADGRDTGRVASAVSAANTIGAIGGAVAFSLLLIPALGTAGSERVIIGLSVAAALAACIPAFAASSGAHGQAVRRFRLEDAVALIVLASVAAGLAWRVTPVPWWVICYGRHAQRAASTGAFAPGVIPAADVPGGPGKPSLFCTYLGEGMNVSVAVTQTRAGRRNFHGAGKVQASTAANDMRLQRMLGHLPPLLQKKPRSVLVVACGAGITAGSFLLHPDVERIVICDIEPLVPKHVAPLFGKENYHVVDGIAERNPLVVEGKQVEVVYDDGRHYLRTTREKFDVITSDPIDPWVKGCAALNTVEYYQACREHLKPGGSVSLWVPLYESDLATAKSFIGTFFSVFPDGILWSNERKGQGYDGVLFGQAEPPVIDLDALQLRLARPDHARVKESLEEVGFGLARIDGNVNDPSHKATIDLLASYAGHGRGLGAWLRAAQINTDGNLRLQYLAGMSLNVSQGALILKSILAEYRFPDHIIVGSPARVGDLRLALRAAGRIDVSTAAPGVGSSTGANTSQP